MKAAGPLLLLASMLAACDEQQSRAESDAAQAQARAVIPSGSAPRGAMAYLSALAPAAPDPTPALLERGRDGYGVFCAPCHGSAGRGDGIVTRNGLPSPPTFHDDRQRDFPPERIVAIITDGYGRMWPLAENIPPADRWAIAGYVKALQARGGSERP